MGPKRIYQPLNQATRETRLLTLLPAALDANVDAPLECNLTTMPLDTVAIGDDGEEFQALSYTWGEPGGERSVIISGIEMKISPNLYDALRTFRDENVRPGCLWVDAICINQDDVAEKNHQVPLMGDIYGFAGGVHVWLGWERTETVRLIDRLNSGMWQAEEEWDLAELCQLARND